MSATPPELIYKRSHFRVVLAIVTSAIVIAAGCSYWIQYRSPVPMTLTVHDQWAIFCYAFVASWWLVYFVGARFKVPTLRAFLRERWAPPKPGENAEYSALAEAINTKAASLIQAQGIYVAVISLLLAYVVQLSDATAFQALLGRVALTSALIAILLLVLSSDMIDTASNRFGSRALDQKIWEIKRDFYTGINPPGIGGFAYVGFAFFTFFIIVAISLIWWPLSGIAVAVFGYVGYRYWFGYEKLAQPVSGADQFRHDAGIAWPPVLIPVVFLIVTLVLYVLD